MLPPTPNTLFTTQGFIIEVINGFTDPRNKNADGTYKRVPDDTSIIYEYKTPPVGKIGRCKTLEGFYTMVKL